MKLEEKLIFSKNGNNCYINNNEEILSNHYLFSDMATKKWAVINNDTYKIIQFCNGEHTINQIIQHFQNTYTEISPDIIKTFIIEILQSCYTAKVLFKSEDEYKLNVKKNIDTKEEAIKSVYIELTTNCNLKCIHCFGDFGIKNQIFHLDKLKSLLKELNCLRYNTILYSGGEPLLYPEIINACEIALDMGYKVAVATNGTLNIDKLFHLLSNDKFKIQISLDGITQPSHEFIRGKDSFAPTINTINKLIDLNLSHKISISTTIHSQNINEIENIIQWCIKHNIREIGFRELMPLGRAGDNWEKITVCLQGEALISYLPNKYKDEITIQDIGVDKESITFNHMVDLKEPCSLGNNLRIDTMGNVYPCQLLSDPQFIIGNIYEDTIENVINNEKMNELKQCSIVRREKTEKCSKCMYLHFCGGGCMAQAYAEHKTIYSPSPLCNIRRKILTQTLKERLPS